MKTLELSVDNSNEKAFAVELANWKGVKDSYAASLYRDYAKEGDGVYWGLKGVVCVKSHYTQADRDFQAKMAAMEPVVDGEVVLIDGEKYVANVKGIYSDCVVFEKV